MSDNVRRGLQEISLGITDEVADMPLNLCDSAEHATQHCLIVKSVYPRKQNLRALSMAMPRVWGVTEEITGKLLESNKVKFMFRSEKAMNTVVRRGPWSFMITTHKWSSLQDDDDLDSIPFWVQIRGIPQRHLTLPMVTQIGITLGHFIETDFAADGSVLVDYVRVKLLWNIAHPLRFQRLFRFGVHTAVLSYCYEKLRQFCTICGMLSHDVIECPLNSPLPPPPPSSGGYDD